MLAGYYCFVAGAIMSQTPAKAAANDHARGFRTNRPMQGRRPDGIGVYTASRVEELKLAWPSLGTCRPWCSICRARRSKRPNCRRPARARAGPDPGRGLRRVPHRSACRRRRTAAIRSCRSCPATRSSARGGARRGRRRLRRSATASACRGSAGPAALRLLPQRPRESVRRAALHRLPDRRRLCRTTPSPTSATAFRCPRRYGDAEAAPLLCAGLIGYRALRMAGDARSASGSTASAPRRISSRRWRAHQGREVFRLHPARRRAQAQDFAARARRGVGRRLRRSRRPSRSTRRSSSRRSARSCRPRCAPCARAASVVCGGIHMSDIPPSRTASCGRSGCCARSPTSPAPTRENSSRWRRNVPIKTR